MPKSILYWLLWPIFFQGWLLGCLGFCSVFVTIANCHWNSIQNKYRRHQTIKSPCLPVGGFHNVYHHAAKLLCLMSRIKYQNQIPDQNLLEIKTRFKLKAPDQTMEWMKCWSWIKEPWWCDTKHPSSLLLEASRIPPTCHHSVSGILWSTWK